MKASELILKLQERIDIYGDLPLQLRIVGDVVDVGSVFADVNEENIIISNVDVFDFSNIFMNCKKIDPLTREIH